MKALIILFLITLCLPACSSEPEAPVVKPVKTVVVGTSAATAQRSFAGKVDALQNVQLSFQVPGRIESLPIKEGQTFKHGDLIAKLDARDYENELASKQASQTKAKQDLERFRQLWTRDAVPLADLQAKERNYDIANAALQIAEKQVEDTRIRAPFDGHIGRKLAEENQEVQAKQTVATFLDLSQLKIIVDVPEAMVLQAKKDSEDKFVATFAKIPDREFNLSIHEFGATADPVTRTFPVTLVMPTPEDVTILPGMTASVEWEGGTAQVAGSTQFFIPSGSVVTNTQGQQTVWVVDPESMTVSARTVQLGKLSGDQVHVTNGLQGGERIVTAGAAFLHEGMEVRLLEETREQANP